MDVQGQIHSFVSWVRTSSTSDRPSCLGFAAALMQAAASPLPIFKLFRPSHVRSQWPAGQREAVILRGTNLLFSWPCVCNYTCRKRPQILSRCPTAGTDGAANPAPCLAPKWGLPSQTSDSALLPRCKSWTTKQGGP